MMEEFINEIKNDKVKLPKLKGHTKITLTDINTKEERVIESDNLVTDAVASMFKNDYYNLLNCSDNTFLPVRQLFGGVLCFEDRIDENASNIYPPSENQNHLVAHCGDNNNTTILNSKLGTLSSDSKESIDGKSFTWVWDFNPNQGNGTINSVCLTSKWGGNIGLTPTTQDFSAYYTPSGRNYYTIPSDLNDWNRKWDYFIYNYSTRKGYRALAIGEGESRQPYKTGIRETVLKNYDAIKYGLNTGFKSNNEQAFADYHFESEKTIWLPEENLDGARPDPWNYTLNYLIYNPSNNGYILIHRSCDYNNPKWDIIDITRNEVTYELNYTYRHQGIDWDLNDWGTIDGSFNRSWPTGIPIKDNTWAYITPKESRDRCTYLYKLNLNTLEKETVNMVPNPNPGGNPWTLTVEPGVLSRSTINTTSWIGDLYFGGDFIINGDVIYPAGSIPFINFVNKWWSVSPNNNTPLYFSGHHRGNSSDDGIRPFMFTPYLATINNLPNPVTKTQDQAMRIEYTLTEMEE